MIKQVFETLNKLVVDENRRPYSPRGDIGNKSSKADENR